MERKLLTMRTCRNLTESLDPLFSQFCVDLEAPAQAPVLGCQLILFLHCTMVQVADFADTFHCSSLGSGVSLGSL